MSVRHEFAFLSQECLIFQVYVSHLRRISSNTFAGIMAWQRSSLPSLPVFPFLPVLTLSLCSRRICHCEGDEGPLITPCHCTGSLRYVHQSCLQQWIKSSDTRCCELCKYEFIMETKLKPLRKVRPSRVRLIQIPTIGTLLSSQSALSTNATLSF